MFFFSSSSSFIVSGYTSVVGLETNNSEKSRVFEMPSTKWPHLPPLPPYYTKHSYCTVLSILSLLYYPYCHYCTHNLTIHTVTIALSFILIYTGVTLVGCCCWWSCTCWCCCCWLRFCCCPIAKASVIIALFTAWLSLVGLCCLLQRPGIQHLQNWYRKKDSTSAITKITKTPVEPPKLKATMASLSVSEADVRIVSSTWGAVCVFPISVLLGALYHSITMTVADFWRCMAWVPIYTGVNPQPHCVEGFDCGKFYFKRSGHTIMRSSRYDWHYCW